MPWSISEYIVTKDFDFVMVAQRNLNDSYIAEMAKYATPHETTKIMAVWSSVPEQLAKENHKFQYKIIKSGARAYDYEIPLDWLKAEVDFVFQDRKGNIIPLEVKSAENVKAKSLKLFMSLYQPPYSIRVSAKNFGYENNIKRIPFYGIFCLTT